MNSHMKMYIGQGLGVPRQELLSPWIWGMSPSWKMDVFTNMKAIQTPYFRDIYRGFIMLV